MGKIARPLNPAATKVADDELYGRHASDPRPNALYATDGKRKPLDPTAPGQAGLRSEWRASYERETASAKKPAEPNTRRPADPVQPCPCQEWVVIRLLRPTKQARPAWWPSGTQATAYASEPFGATLSDGRAENGNLDGQGHKLFDQLPPGTCTFTFGKFYDDIAPWLKKVIG